MLQYCRKAIHLTNTRKLKSHGNEHAVAADRFVQKIRISKLSRKAGAPIRLDCKQAPILL
jgi:hypothetical protein